MPGKHAQALSLRTRANFTETEALLASGKLDHARAEALVFSNRGLAADMVVPPLLALCAGAAQPAETAATSARKRSGGRSASANRPRLDAGAGLGRNRLDCRQ
jgi:acyl-homoserine-lactone acylase